MTNKLVDGGNIVVSAGYNEAVNGYPLNSVFGYRYVGKVQNQDQLDYYVDKMWAATLLPYLPTCVWATTCMKM